MLERKSLKPGHTTSVVRRLPMISASLIILLTGCGQTETDATLQTPAGNVTSPQASADDSKTGTDNGPVTAFVPVADNNNIPYPLYPNGSRYRIGGENGLKIVVFETTDKFDQVDSFYNQSLAKKGDAARNLMMADAVRYTPAGHTGDDPWDTETPGIVIHEFADPDEASRYGAAAQSKTNIIMSFK